MTAVDWNSTNRKLNIEAETHFGGVLGFQRFH